MSHHTPPIASCWSIISVQAKAFFYVLYLLYLVFFVLKYPCKLLCCSVTLRPSRESFSYLKHSLFKIIANEQIFFVPTKKAPHSLCLEVTYWKKDQYHLDMQSVSRERRTSLKPRGFSYSTYAPLTNIKYSCDYDY